MFKNKRILYLVQHSEKSVFKIGIATNNDRFLQLDKIYQIDWSTSLCFIGENDHVTKMERILHRLFYEFNEGVGTTDGSTEWFSSKCLNHVVEAILFNVKNSNFNICLEPQEILLEEKTKPIKKPITEQTNYRNPVHEQLIDYVFAEAATLVISDNLYVDPEGSFSHVCKVEEITDIVGDDIFYQLEGLITRKSPIWSIGFIAKDKIVFNIRFLLKGQTLHGMLCR